MVAYLQGHLARGGLLLADLARHDAPPGERLDIAGARRAGRIVGRAGLFTAMAR
jgi:hypothetical protein